MLCGLGKQRELDTDLDSPQKKGSNGLFRLKKIKKPQRRISEDREIATCEVERSLLKAENTRLQKLCDEQASAIIDLEKNNKIITSELKELERQIKQLIESNKIWEMLTKELQLNNDQLVLLADSNQTEISELAESELRLQTQVAQKVKENEELANEKSNWKKISGILKEKNEECSTLRKVNTLLERNLVEKTQHILNLEACLNLIASQLAKLRDIPDSMLTSTAKMQNYISQETNKLHDTLRKSGKQMMAKLDALKNAWDSFSELDIPLATDGQNGNLRERKLPEWLKGPAKKLSYTLGPNWIDAGRALGLEGDDLEKIASEWTEFGMQELTLQLIETWYRQTVHERLNLETLGQAMEQLEINALLLNPMSQSDKDVLLDNYQKLTDDMGDVTLVEGYLRAGRVLSATAVSYIITPHTRYGRIQRLLKVLPYSGSRALPVFRDALLKSNQPHLAMYLMEANHASEKEMLSGSQGDITQEIVTQHMDRERENLRKKMEIMTELQKLILRGTAETKKEVLLAREDLERGKHSKQKATPMISEASDDVGRPKAMTL